MRRPYVNIEHAAESVTHCALLENLMGLVLDAGEGIPRKSKGVAAASRRSRVRSRADRHARRSAEDTRAGDARPDEGRRPARRSAGGAHVLHGSVSFLLALLQCAGFRFIFVFFPFSRSAVVRLFEGRVYLCQC